MQEPLAAYETKGDSRPTTAVTTLLHIIMIILITSPFSGHSHRAVVVTVVSGLGSHVSFVRSIKMDSWSAAQLDRMRSGGNAACQSFLAQHGIDVDHTGSNSSSSISFRDKYDTPAAQLYQQVLKARVDGTPEPTELPPPPAAAGRSPPTFSARSCDPRTSSAESCSVPVGATKKVMEGFGSTPLPSPPTSASASRLEQRRKMVLGVGAAAVGAIAVGLAASKKKWQQRQEQKQQHQHQQRQNFSTATM